MKNFFCILLAAIAGLSLSSSAQTILFEDFLSVTTPALPAGWSNTFTADSGTTPQGWVTITNTADYMWTGLLIGHAQYAECTEGYYYGNNPANLTTPVFSLSGAGSPYLSFDYWFDGYHYYSGGVGYFEHAYVLISADSGTTWHYIDTLPGVPGWATRYINLGAYAGSANCMIRFQYTDGGGTFFGYMVTDVKVFNAVTSDISLVSITPATGVPNFVATSSGISIGGIITNLGASAVTSFTATYQPVTGSPVTSSFSGLSIAPTASYTFTCTTPFTPTVLDSVPVKLWVTETGDTIHSNDTLTTGVTGVTHFPTNKIVAEEATGTWCDYCPEGIVAIDGLSSSAMSLIAVHVSLSTLDPMTDWVYGYGSWMYGEVPSFPHVLINRIENTDPTNLVYYYDEHHTDFAYADIDMTTSISGTTITVPVTINPATNLNGVYKLAFVLTEDSVHSSSTPSDWDQANVYSGGGSGPMADAEYNFVTLPNPVPATTMYYHHVARLIEPSVYGGDYLPGILTAGTNYYHTFTAPVTTGWVLSRMHAIVMLIDSATGFILNSQNAWLYPPLKISKVSTGIEQVTIYPNPAGNIVKVQFDLANEAKVTVEVADMLGRVLYTSSNLYQQGSCELAISTGSFVPGSYIVKVSTGLGGITKHLSLIK